MSDVKSLLVIDEDPSVANMLRSELADDEWTIQSENNGRAGLLRVAARRPSVVLAALEAPGVEGPEYIRRVRRLRQDSKVIVTALATTPADVIESIKAHAFAHFTKPFDAPALAHMIIEAGDTLAWKDGIETLSASPQWIELRVRCRMVTADRLVQFCRETKLDLPAEEREGIATAFHEMLVNAMEHGGRFDPEQTVDVSYMRTDRSLIYSIADPGSGFSLDDLPHAAISYPEDEHTQHLLYRMEHGMRAGGFGILFARKLVDELVHNERGNKVLLIKYLSDSSQ